MRIPLHHLTLQSESPCMKRRLENLSDLDLSYAVKVDVVHVRDPELAAV